ncbi:hypothetical protein D1B32_11590 [Oceanobacillus profundus]|uniref:Uncharacterized protein n=1 Tax=Oceanobacillus profundus TaxID=372463 RepID=A0A417YGI3_9BACI|nr:hypothetical protein D1B32_11590 [Oceanobacillus profundus]
MFFKKEFKYHVVYTYQNNNTGGDGSITIRRNKKIKTSADVNGIREFIETEYSMGKVVIKNWIRLTA